MQGICMLNYFVFQITFCGFVLAMLDSSNIDEALEAAVKMDNQKYINILKANRPSIK